MCTAYEIGKRQGSFPVVVKAAALHHLLGLSGTQIIRPTIPAPVLTADGILRSMKWGFRRAFAPKVKGNPPVWRTIVNSREDKLAGPTWKKAFISRRCLIPAAAFYEWVVVSGTNTPLRFERPGDEWLWIAGIWEESDEHGECFSMITTEPNAVMAAVHDRMPAVLADDQIAPYLNGELHSFGPTSVALKFTETANFLKVGDGKKSPPPIQGDLF